MDEAGGGKKKKRKKRAAVGEAAPAPLPLRGNAWTALAVTLLVPLAVVPLSKVGLPTVDLGAVQEMAQRAGSFRTSASASFGAFSLGVMPILSAIVVVELVALVVPGLNRLRHAGPAGRAKLGRIAIGLGVALAAFQSYGVAEMLNGLARGTAIGSVSVPLVTLSLVAGTMLLALLADFATRRGLVSGFLTILIASMMMSLVREFRGWHEGHVVPGLVATSAGAFAAAVATWATLRSPKPTIRLEPAKSPDPYRGKGLAADASSLDVPTPPSGLEPYFATASLPALSTTLANLKVPFGRTISDALMVRPIASRAAFLASLVVLGVVFGSLFYQPNKVAALWRRAGSRVDLGDLLAAARRLLRRGVAISILYLFGLFAIAVLVGWFHGPGSIVLLAALLVAVALDAVDAWRALRRSPDLVVVWSDQRPYAPAAAREALAGADIPLFVGGERFRRLSPFGVFVPLDLMVPAVHVDRASKILAVALGSGTAEQTNDAPVRAVPDDAHGTRRWPIIAAAAVVGGGTLAIPSEPPEPKRTRGPMRPETLQLVAVDDDVDPQFDAAPKAAYPPCLEIATEVAPIGPSKTAIRHFAKCLAGDGVTMAAARDELLRWAATISVPPGERFVAGPVDDYDEATERLTEVGVRSWLMKEEPVLDGNDVTSAEVRMTNQAEGTTAPVVLIELSSAGGEKLLRFTSNHVGKRMAIVVEGSVISAPRITSPISGGRLQLTMGAGDLDRQIAEADHLADVLMGQPSSPSSDATHR